MRLQVSQDCIAKDTGNLRMLPAKVLGMLVAFIGGSAAFSPSMASNVVTQPRRHDGMFMQQNPLVDRRAVLLGAGALAFSQNSAAFAKGAPEKRNSDVTNDLLKLAFEQSKKLVFAELGWGDEEAKLLGKTLTRESVATKLDLNGNKIADAGVTSLADSLRAGAAPKLKTIILGGNSGVSDSRRQP